MRISEVCRRDVATALRETPLAETAGLMRERHVGSVVVIDSAASGKPLGIVTDRDMVIEVLAAGLDPRTIVTGDIMSAPLFTARESDDVMALLRSMRIRGVRRVPVLDDSGRLAGITTLDDLLVVAGDAVCDAVGAIGSERSLETWRRR